MAFKKHLEEDVLSDEKSEANRLKAKACHFCLHKKSLYQKEKGRPDLKCLTELRAHEVLKELHEGVCR